MDRFGGGNVDVEPDSVSFKVEANHPAVGKKLVRFAYGEDGQAANALQNGALTPGLVPAQKQDVAALEIGPLVENAHLKYPISDGLPVQRAAELLTVRVVVENTEVKNTILSIESPSGQSTS